MKAFSAKSAPSHRHHLLGLAAALLTLVGSANALDRTFITDDTGAPVARKAQAPYKAGFDRVLLSLANVESSKDALPHLQDIIAQLDKATQKLSGKISLEVIGISGAGLFVIKPSVLLNADQFATLATILYTNDKAIQTVQPSFLYQPLGLYADLPVIREQWNINAPSEDPGPDTWGPVPYGSINAREAWSYYRDLTGDPRQPPVQGQYQFGGPTSGMFAGQANVTVAVLDTGITLHHGLMPRLISRHLSFNNPHPGAPDYSAGADLVSDFDNARDGSGHDPIPQDEGDWTAQNEATCGFINEQYHPSSYHGTHVAGIIAAQPESGSGEFGIGMTGVAPRANVIPVRVIGRCGARTEDIVDGIHWAIGDEIVAMRIRMGGIDATFNDDDIGGRNPQPARIINLSLGANIAAQMNAAGAHGTLSAQHCRVGFARPSFGIVSIPLGGDTVSYPMMLEQTAITNATSRGVMVVTSAGNDGTDVAQSAPAACDNVITVGAVNYIGQRAGYSNFNRDTTPANQIIDVLAPGGEDRLEYKYPDDLGLASEPHHLAMGYITLTEYGYLDRSARTCPQQAPFFVPSMGDPFTNTGVATSTWQISHMWWPQGGNSGYRWSCENAGPGWVQPLLVDHSKSILSTLPLQRAPGEAAGAYSYLSFRGPGSGYDYMQGTSMAAPHVAGVIALMLSVNPNLTFAQVKAGLRASARPMEPGDCLDTEYRFPTEYDLSGNPLRTASLSATTTSDVGACGAGIADAPGAVRYAASLRR